MQLTEKALRIAMIAHSDQVDKGGAPYIFHPIRVKENVSVIGNTYTAEEAHIVALLHDVLEDSHFTEDDLAKEFSVEVVDAVLALTKQAGESYDSYLQRIKDNKLATAVKLADLADNQRLERINRQLTAAEADKMVVYLTAERFLRS